MTKKFEKVTLVHVVMSNDYPDAVFTSKHLAEEYCRLKMAEQKKVPPIYYRPYVMELRDRLEDGRR